LNGTRAVVIQLGFLQKIGGVIGTAQDDFGSTAQLDGIGRGRITRRDGASGGGTDGVKHVLQCLGGIDIDAVSVDGEGSIGDGISKGGIRKGQTRHIIGRIESPANVGRTAQGGRSSQLADIDCVVPLSRPGRNVYGGDGLIGDAGAALIEKVPFHDILQSVLKDGEFGFQAAVGTVFVKDLRLLYQQPLLWYALQIGQLVHHGHPVESRCQS